jgi:hypothetical protein
MRSFRSAAILATAAIGGALLFGNPAGALPFTPAQATVPAKIGDTLPTLQVRNRGGAVAAGILGGLIVGGIIASQGPYYEGYPPYGYDAPYPAYGYYPAYPGGGGATAYCARRFRSYDPMSGTYLGYDGLRHPCP